MPDNCYVVIYVCYKIWLDPFSPIINMQILPTGFPHFFNTSRLKKFDSQQALFPAPCHCTISSFLLTSL